jgi:AraC family transcriptional regulator
MVLQDPGEYRERDIPLEVIVPVPAELVRRAPASSGERVRLRTLMNSGEAACLVHSGPPETLGQAYAALYGWLEANRRVPAAPAREIYHNDLTAASPADPFGEPAQVQAAPQAIEIQIPVESILSETERKTKERENNMNPKIVSRPAFTVMGLRYQGNNQNQEIGALWGEFDRRESELLSVAVPNSCAYGVCVMAEGLPEGHFEYIASFEVPAGTQPLPGMVVRDLPANQYAVFEHHGSLDRLRETYHNIYHVWLPQSGLQVVPGADMEVYTEAFKDDSPDSMFYIYVPVK